MIKEKYIKYLKIGDLNLICDIFVKAVKNVAKVLVIAVQIVVIILESVVLNAVEMMKRV